MSHPPVAAARFAPSVRVLFSPTEYEAIARQDLSTVTCVVFDVLRATSTMLEALSNGATGIRPAREIAEAIALRGCHPQALLAGERDGLRIRANQTGGIDFDLGNSPREFSRNRVEGREIIMTTTNGTRALEACRLARAVFIASFGNLSAMARHLVASQSECLWLICSGTLENASFEDTLGAGALVDRLLKETSEPQTWSLDDSSQIAWDLYRGHQPRLPEAARCARNGRRLLAQLELAGDIPVCFEEDRNPHVVQLGADQVLRKIH